MEKVLEFTSIGNAIISELLKISQIIPNEFQSSDSKKYDEIIMDFKYFRIMEALEKKIENDEHLSELDEFIRESYSKILLRFYLAFESVYEYGANLNSFVNDLNEGVYIQTTLDSIFQDEEGRQLICESLYLYAVMLIVLDVFIPGEVRERLLIGYYRYHSQNSDSSIDDVCKFCRSTGYNPQNTATTITHFQPSCSSAGYPENFFERIPIDPNFVSNVIETLKSEDIYHQMQKFPSPEHRTIALSAQSSMLFACLYFQPDTLMNQHSRMREICDKFYYNNWIISIYMGLTVNLFDAWDGYKAAKGALTKILEPQMIKEITIKNQQTLKRMIESTRGLLKEGVLKEDFLLKNLDKIIKVIRECNFCLRWFFLNSSNVPYTKKSKYYCDLVRNTPNFNISDQYDLIVNLSQLELVVKEIAKDLLDNKEQKWNKFKDDVKEKLSELKLFFGEASLVLKVEKNEKLQSWFEDISKEVDTLELKNKPRMVEKKLAQMIEAFSEVQEYHTSYAHAKQRNDEVISIFNSMIHLLHIKDTILVDLQAIGDFSYAWYLIEDFTPFIHASLKKTPNILIKLRALFIKLSTVLEIPLMRINQFGGAEEFVSITCYYSNELVKYVRKIVQIIPHSIFNLLKSIIELQTNHLKELPERLEKDKVKEFAQLPVRQEIAKLTFNISIFTDGIMAMEKTLVGVIELDPKQLLEDGIRKELVKHVAEALNEVIQFNEKQQKNPKEILVVEKLNNLAKIIKGLRSTFEYVQDYLNISGLLIWKEEIMRIINFNVEQECNTFKKKKLQFSKFQSDSISIPTFPALPNDPSLTFIGRLGREILKITDPKYTIYVDLLTSWYDVKSHQEIVDQKFTNLLLSSIDVHGVVGIDKIYSYMISDDLEHIHKVLLKSSIKEKQWSEMLLKFKTDLDARRFTARDKSRVENPFKHYQSYINKSLKLPNILPKILSIGQKVIWRCHIAHELVTSSRINCRNVVNSLSAFNDALLYELKCHEIDNSKPKPSAELLLEVNKHLELVGLYNPVDKVYIKMTKNSSEFLNFMVIFTLSNLKNIAFGKNLLKFNKTNSIYSTAIMKHRKNIIDVIHSRLFLDGHVFLLGIITLLKQFYENNYLMEFVDMLGSCLFEMLEFNLSSKHELSMEIMNGIDLLETMITLTGLPRSVLEENIPRTLLDQRDHLLTVVPNMS